MPNRRRIAQRQSGRVYFQEHDHRDIIMGDNYHGAVYIGEDIEPKWRKYKPRLIHFVNSYPISPYYNGGAFAFDVTNQFFSLAMQEDYEDEGITPLPADDDRYFCLVGSLAWTWGISKNGYDFKRIGDTSPYFNEWHRYGSNYTVNIINYPSSSDVVTMGWAGIRYNEGQQTADTYTVSTATYSKSNDHIYGRSYCGRQTDGCFLAYSERTLSNNVYYCHDYLSLSTNRSTLSLIWEHSYSYNPNQDYTIKSAFNDSDNKIWKCGTNYISGMIITERTGSSTDYSFYFRTSSDSDLSTWTENLILHRCGSNCRIACVMYRNGTAYIYVWLANYNLALFTTSDFSTFTQVQLPDYIDIPFLDSADIDNDRYGAVDNPTYDAVRLVINNTAVLPSLPNDYVQFTLTSFGDRYEHQNYFESINGTLTENISSTDMLITHIIGSYTAIYLDNMSFQTSNGNVAYALLYNWNGADPIASGDYVFGGGNNG